MALVNKPDIWKVKKIHSNLLAEQDDTLLKKSSLNEETQFGLLVALTTKLKVINDSLEIFTYFKNNDLIIKTDQDREKLFMITKQLVKRINLHLYQIRKLNPSDYNSNRDYYSTYIKIIYNYIIFGKITAL